MNLKQYFRLVMCSIFQSGVKGVDSFHGTHFYLPKVYCKDGWNISLQMNYGSYASSENGYRTLGIDMQDVEWGFPSQHEPALEATAEYPEDTTSTVGSIAVNEIQKICDDLHGGIDWDVTLSPSNCASILEGGAKDWCKNLLPSTSYPARMPAK